MIDQRAIERRLRDHLAGASDAYETDGQLYRVMGAVARTRQRPSWEVLLRGDAGRVASARPSLWIASRYLRRLVAIGAAVLLLVVMLLAVSFVGSTPPVSDPVPGIIATPAQLYGRWEASIGRGPRASSTYRLDIGRDVTLTGPGERPLPELGGPVEVTPLDDAPDAYSVRITGSCGIGDYEARVVDNTGLRFASGSDACAERSTILTADEWGYVVPDPDVELGPFRAGETYDSGVFTEPFHFVMPAIAFTEADGALEGQFERAKSHVADGGIRFGGAYWSMVILDDLPVSADLCDRSRPLLPDIPPTPEAVLSWFRDSGPPISEPTEVQVDGRTALRWEATEVDPPCQGWRMPAGGFFEYVDFAYAIPTGDDTILIVGGSDDVNDTTVQRAVDDLIRSIVFD